MRLGVCPAALTNVFYLQKRNGMMDPDDFRACLISMGYDLVSILETDKRLSYRISRMEIMNIMFPVDRVRWSLLAL